MKEGEREEGQKIKQLRRRRKTQLERRRGAEEKQLRRRSRRRTGERKHSWEEKGVRTQNSLIEGGDRIKTA